MKEKHCKVLVSDMTDRMWHRLCHYFIISCNLLVTSGKITISLPSFQWHSLHKDVYIFFSFIYQFKFKEIRLNMTFILLHLRN